MRNWEAVIGLEIHAQLLTRTKMFCACDAAYGEPPNTRTCPVCLGHPGTLPVVNGEAVGQALKVAFALNCRVRPESRFARKNYFYPDLPKGYQITQLEAPLAEGGRLGTEVAGRALEVGILRAHLEEDSGKSLHEGFPDSARKAYLDFNRAGVPLLEIVTAPDLQFSRGGLRVPPPAEAGIDLRWGVLRSDGGGGAALRRERLPQGNGVPWPWGPVWR